MNKRNLGHKQVNKQTILAPYFFALIALVCLVPTPAAAFQLGILTTPTQILLEQAQLVSQPATTPVPITLQINDASALAMNAMSPITTEGNWSHASAWVPVTNTFATTSKNIVSVIPQVLKGTASFYSRAGCLGCNAGRIMANGQPLNDNALTIAIGADLRHLVGGKAKITNEATGQSVIADITDTGGFHTAKYGYRVADLSVATKEAIGMNGGLARVTVEIQ